MEYDNVDYEILLKVSSHVTNGWTWREDGKFWESGRSPLWLLVFIIIGS